MKLREISCYQHVRWGKSTRSHFNIDTIDAIRDEKLELSFDSQNSIVNIKQGEYSLIIPVTNVSYMIPLVEEKKSTSKSKTKD